MFAMKRIHLFAGVLVALAAIIIGCAGSSNDTPNTTGGDITGTPRIEAVVVVDRTNLKDPSKYTDAELQDPLIVNPNDLINKTLYGVQDPKNIQTEEEYYFQLVYYDEGGTRRIIDNSEVVWTLSTPTGLFGQIGNNSGLFVAPNRVTFDNQFVYATYRNTRYQIRYAVLPRQVRLIGQVATEGNGNPVKGVKLFFFDQFNAQVGEVESSYDGSFRASVPLSAVKFAPTVDSLPANYYQTFLFKGLRYTVGVAACKAPLPTLDIVGAFILEDEILLKVRQDGVPTPDPTGCED
jgi:hypothetical protein